MWARLSQDVNDLAVLAGVSLAFGIIRLMMVSEHVGVKAAFSSLLLSVLAGTLCGAIVLDFGHGDHIALVASSMVSILSKEALLGIVANQEYLGTLFRRAAQNLTDKFTK